MQSFDQKVAFITGAASGIGLALSKALNAKNCKVVMADIDGAALEKEAQALNGGTQMVRTVICDVTRQKQVSAAADKTMEVFGRVDLLFNNAGVGLGGSPGLIPLEDWQWIVDINLMGIVYGIESFVPLMRQHGDGGHIVNTASMAGHATMPGMAPYHATKFAAVGYSETLRQELAPENIGVSVLCPTWIKTNIHKTGANRPTANREGNDTVKSSGADKVFAQVKSLVENGISPDVFAELVLKSVQANRLYVFNDPEARAAIDMRHQQIQADYAACLKDLGLA